MENDKKIKMLQVAYAGVMADSVLRLGNEGVLEKVTEQKKKEQFISGKAVAAQMGIEKPEEVLERIAEIFGCAAWSTKAEGNITVSETITCMLCSLAKRIGAPCPCNIYCINPTEGMIKGIEPNAELEVVETLWEGKKCRFEIARN